jgi:hypothetical protein
MLEGIPKIRKYAVGGTPTAAGVMLRVAILRNYENRTYYAVGGDSNSSRDAETAAGGIKKLSNAHARVWKPAPEGNLFPRAVILSFTNNTHESAFQLLRQPVFLLKLMPPVSICLIC